ncbi:MAG: MOSC domain-containing protein [Myxococcota bacterium]|nr:MOSC domain-containing protein [Myxococcota bacterium]
MSDVLALSVSEPRTVSWQGREVRTGIFKEPVDGRRRLSRTGFEGDGQADLESHGGVDKAAYVYSHDHYAHWEQELGRSLPFGQLGENLTVRGWTEDVVHIGDVFRLGEARVEVTQPRVPCFKLGIRMDSARFPKRFLASLRSGFYLRVLEEGRVGAGDPMERLEVGAGNVAVREAMHLLHFARDDRDGARRVLGVPALSADWRRSFEDLLA